MNFSDFVYVFFISHLDHWCKCILFRFYWFTYRLVGHCDHTGVIFSLRRSHGEVDDPQADNDQEGEGEDVFHCLEVNVVLLALLSRPFWIGGYVISELLCLEFPLKAFVVFDSFNTVKCEYRDKAYKYYSEREVYVVHLMSLRVLMTYWRVTFDFRATWVLFKPLRWRARILSLSFWDSFRVRLGIYCIWLMFNDLS